MAEQRVAAHVGGVGDGDGEPERAEDPVGAVPVVVAEVVGDRVQVEPCGVEDDPLDDVGGFVARGQQ
jgi:hypothetical protein